ncbi:MAG: hypothetical protein AB4080_01975 [Trichodesmium sp.]
MIKKFKIGVTVPSEVSYGSSRAELEVKLQGGENIFEEIGKAKVLLAELIAGGVHDQYIKALDCMNHPSTSAELDSKKEELKAIQSQLTTTSRELASKKKEARQVLNSLKKYQVIDRLKMLSLPSDFWDDLKDVMNDLHPDRFDEIFDINQNAKDEEDSGGPVKDFLEKF